ncbi:lysine-rich nucleolar protein 1-like isoform X1 [Haliotis rufescens]|uniref:lysine-rich nucleolar protein 1-like isoform X1 n=2 Tax=Haliotis rufescens TaxID=6454 RepID=UPI00201E78F3|nr:lysine-rich nucleolar protein 1-like isoform X1 [Haliotis rufescens]
MYFSSQTGPLDVSPLGGVLTFGISLSLQHVVSRRKQCFGKSFNMGDTVISKKSKKKRKNSDLDIEVAHHDPKNTAEKTRKKKKKELSDSGIALETEHDSGNTKETLKKKCKKKRKHEPELDDKEGSDSVSSGEIKAKKRKSKKSKRKEVHESEDSDQLELAVPPKKKKKRKKQREKDVVTERQAEITHLSKEKCEKRDKSVKGDHLESDEGTVNEENTSKKKKKKKKQKQEDNEETPVEDSKCEDIHAKKKKKKKKHNQDALEENNDHHDSIEKISNKKNRKQHNSLPTDHTSKEKPNSYNSQPFDYGSEDKSGGDISNNTSGPYLGQWGTASLGNNERQQKFARLLGGFKKGGNLGQNKPGLFGKLGTKSSSSNSALNRAEEDILNKNLESDFEKALAFRLSKEKSSGLGFAPPPEEGKKFYIDKTSSKSIKFDDSD